MNECTFSKLLMGNEAKGHSDGRYLTKYGVWRCHKKFEQRQVREITDFTLLCRLYLAFLHVKMWPRTGIAQQGGHVLAVEDTFSLAHIVH